jgi:polar amino acid transport system substrate-binding protein
MDKKKIYISITASLVFFIAIIWLLMRACSGGPFLEKKTLQIGRDSTWYPLDLRRKEKAVVGFSNDLMDAIGKDQGFKAIVFEVGANALLDGLDIGNYDAVFSSYPPNPMNKKKYAFSEPFYLIGPVLAVRDNSTIKSVKDMSGRILGIESGALQVFNILEPSDVIIIPYPTSAKALEDLDASVIDGVLLDALKAYIWTEGFYAGRLKVATAPLTDKGIRLITLNTPEHVKWIEQFNEGLKNVKNDGIYDKLIEKWDLIDTEFHEKNEVPAKP